VLVTEAAGFIDSRVVEACAGLGTRFSRCCTIAGKSSGNSGRMAKYTGWNWILCIPSPLAPRCVISARNWRFSWPGAPSREQARRVHFMLTDGTRVSASCFVKEIQRPERDYPNGFACQARFAIFDAM
jgi:hypothetical protein